MKPVPSLSDRLWPRAAKKQCRHQLSPSTGPQVGDDVIRGEESKMLLARSLRKKLTWSRWQKIPERCQPEIYFSMIPVPLPLVITINITRRAYMPVIFCATRRAVIVRRSNNLIMSATRLITYRPAESRKFAGCFIIYRKWPVTPLELLHLTDSPLCAAKYGTQLRTCSAAAPRTRRESWLGVFARTFGRC